MEHLDYTTTRDKADAWEVAMPLLKAMFTEFRELSRLQNSNRFGAAQEHPS